MPAWNVLDFTNKQLDNLKVLSLSENSKPGYRIWRCQCICGKICEKDSAYLKRCSSQKNLASCGCVKRYKFREENESYKGYKELTGSLWSRYKNGAINRKLEFTISKEYVWKLFEKQNKRCSISGIPINFGDKTDYTKNLTCSLDRIDNLKGYREGNIQWVYKPINMMKNTLSQEEFIKWCTLVIRKSSEEIILPILSQSHKYTGYKSISSTYFYVIKTKAKKRKIKFSISIKDIWNQFEKQNFRCALTNSPIIFLPGFSNNTKLQTASVDRIDPSKGYAVDNIQIVHKKINMIKWTCDNDEFLKICKCIVEFNNL